MPLTIIQYLITYKENLKRRDYLIDLLTHCEHTPLTDDITDPSIFYLGQIVTKGNKTCGIVSIEGDKITTTELPQDSPLLAMYDIFIIKPGDLANVRTTMTTSVGRYILNYLLLADPFGDLFEYINAEFKIGAIEYQIAQAGLSGKIMMAQIKKGYLANAFYIGHFTELSVPSFSAKSLVTGANVIKRREELFEEYKDRLTEPIIMAQIENELIALDREYLKDDPSYGFYGVKSKNFDVCRKRMLLTGGMLETFEKGGAGYTFSPAPLDDGWDPALMPVYANDIRRGTFDRAVNTAKGGEQAEFLRRIFQDSKITESDCKTRRGLATVLTSEVADRYIHRNIITSSGTLTLTKENISKYIDKTVILRSPMYCSTKVGYCYTCMGEVMRKRQVTTLTMMASSIGSKFMTNSLKSMHGKKTVILDVSPVDSFVIR